MLRHNFRRRSGVVKKSLLEDSQVRVTLRRRQRDGFGVSIPDQFGKARRRFAAFGKQFGIRVRRVEIQRRIHLRTGERGQNRVLLRRKTGKSVDINPAAGKPVERTDGVGQPRHLIARIRKQSGALGVIGGADEQKIVQFRGQNGIKFEQQRQDCAIIQAAAFEFVNNLYKALKQLRACCTDVVFHGGAHAFKGILHQQDTPAVIEHPVGKSAVLRKDTVCQPPEGQNLAGQRNAVTARLAEPSLGFVRVRFRNEKNLAADALCGGLCGGTVQICTFSAALASEYECEHDGPPFLKEKSRSAG